MKRAASFYRTAVGKKAVMAVTGIVFWGYVLLHMLGNLKILTGGEALNHYAEWLREMAAPAVPHSGVLWLVRIVLLTALVLHVHATYTLTLMNRRARPVGYRRRHVVQAGWAERTMRWSGVAILLFVIYHILHLTTGTAHQDFVAGDVFHNMTAAFETWWVTLIYVLAATMVGMHLYHGLWSLFQSLGWNHPKYNPWRRVFAVAFSFLIGLGFALPPFLILIGVIQPEPAAAVSSPALAEIVHAGQVVETTQH